MNQADGIEAKKSPNETTRTELNVDTILEKYVGSCGLWQWSLAILTVLASPMMATLPVFVNAMPNVRCRMQPEIEQMFEAKNMTFSQITRFLGRSDGDAVGCSLYATDWSNLSLISEGLRHYDNWIASFSQADWHGQTCPNGYVYESSRLQYPGTVIKEFDLVCEKRWIGPIAIALFMLGMATGFFMGGWLGDRFGRRPMAIGFSMGELIACIVVSTAPNYQVYLFSQVLTAIVSTGKASVLRILPIELTIAKHRSYFTSLNILGVLCVHRVYMAGVAYLIHDWRWLNAGAMAPCFLSLTFYFILPESPRWLFSQSRHSEALKTLRLAARVNQLCFKDRKPPFPPDDYFGLPIIARNRTLKSQVKTEQKCPKVSFPKSLRSLFHNKSLITSLVITCLLLFCNSCINLGVLIYASAIRNYVYIVALINSLAAIPGPLMASFLYRVCRYRRKPLMVMYAFAVIFMLAGALYTILGSPDSDLVLNICCNLTLVIYSSTLIMLTIYSAELFPSNMRVTAVGISSGCGRLGSSLSTFINHLDSCLVHGAPILVYSGLAACQFYLLLLLQDTTGESLPDVDDRKFSIDVNAIEMEKSEEMNGQSVAIST